MSKLRFEITIYALGLLVIPGYLAVQVVTGHWSPRRIQPRLFWKALWRK
jgi:hypothetical protein